MGASWVRGYLGHVYRDASGHALGRIRRCGRPCLEYEWQTANARSTAPDLATAKRMVEASVANATVQPDLFDERATGSAARASVWQQDDEAGSSVEFNRRACAPRFTGRRGKHDLQETHHAE